MSKSTFSNNQNIDFIKTIVALSSNINPMIQDDYENYLDEDELDKTKTFLGAFNLLGQEGCEFLYDKVINYIDDISNVDVCTLDSLFSMANTLQVPYKDKQTVEFLDQLVNEKSNLIQFVLWLISCNTRNTKQILSRFKLLPDEKEFSSRNSILNDGDVKKNIKNILLHILNKTHKIPLSDNSNPKYLLNYYWNFLPIVEDLINSDQEIYSKFIQLNWDIGKHGSVHKLDFGKYNFTIHEYTCLKLINEVEINLSLLDNKKIKKLLPFLFDNNIFDPIEATIKVLFENKNIYDYSEIEQSEINNCIKIIATTGKPVLDSYDGDLGFTAQLNRLNSYNYVDELAITTIINDIKELFNIDFVNYIYYNNLNISDLENIVIKEWWNTTFESSNNTLSQFSFLDDLHFDFDSYLEDVYNELIKMSNKIVSIREGIKILTMRNAFKGTNAIVQLATAEYLNEHLENIIDNAIEDSFNEDVTLPSKIKNDDNLKSTLTDIYNQAILDPSDIKIIEYWDTTEYYGRSKSDDDLYPADWNTNPYTVYGNTSKEKDISSNERDSSDIVFFYKNVLNLPEKILLNNRSKSLDLTKEEDMDFAAENLISFLKSVYNAGIYDRVLPTNLEKIFSGNPTNAILRQFYTNYKTYSLDRNNILDFRTERISKQIHPYIWNFVEDSSGLAETIIIGSTYTGVGSNDGLKGKISVIQQNTALKILEKAIGSARNIIDQWKLDISLFTDESNYYSRYEGYDHHLSDTITHSYDGYVYPPFARDLKYNNINSNSNDILNTEIDGITIYDKWYRRAGGRILRNDEKEKENLVLKLEIDNITNSIVSNNESLENRSILQNYTVDFQGTSYCSLPIIENEDEEDENNGKIDYSENTGTIFYKEVDYPFMRKLRLFDKHNDCQLGISFTNLKDELIHELNSISFPYSHEDNHFPNIIATENGKYLLIRLSEFELGFFKVGSYVNENGTVDKTLQLQYTIDLKKFCKGLNLDGGLSLDELSTKINQGGVKTLGNNIALLLTCVTEEKIFNAYVLSIGPSIYRILKQEVECVKNSDLDHPDANKLTAGLTLLNDLHNDIHCIISIFGIASNITKFNKIKTVGNENKSSLTTDINKTGVDSSFDVFDYFIHKFSIATSNFTNVLNLAKKDNKIEIPSDEEIKALNQITLNADGFNSDYYDNTKLPFARRFNLNSDAGFNNCYLGKSGELVLSEKQSQFNLAKTIGTAITLLGPKNDYTNIDDEEFDQDDNEYATRIHEITYTKLTEEETPTLDFDVREYPILINEIQDYYKTRRWLENENIFYKNKSIPRLFTIKLDKFAKVNDNDIIEDNTLDIEDAEYVYGEIEFDPIDDDLDSGITGNAIMLFRTGYDDIWIPFVIPHDKKIENSGFNFNLFDVIFKGNEEEEIFQKFKINVYDELTDPYIFNSITIKRQGNIVIVAMDESNINKSLPELINIEIIVIGYVGNVGEDVPACILSGVEFSSYISLPNNNTDFHVRVHHTNITEEYDKSANIIKPAQEELIDGKNYYDYNKSFTLSDYVFKDGSAIVSMEEKDSVLLTTILPDQKGYIMDTGKSVLGELLNEMYRRQKYNHYRKIEAKIMEEELADIYDFRYYKFVHLNLLDEDDNLEQNEYYLVRLKSADTNPISYLKDLTFTAWRRAETSTSTNGPYKNVENTLPKKVKITQDDKPVYIHTNEDLDSLDIDINSILPRLAIRWKIVDENLIELRFDNASLADSVFRNKNANLNYISLSNTTSSMQLLPNNNPAYFNITSPIHIIAGNTVFTDIPLITTLLTNVSDNKPKFMLTIDDNTENSQNSDAYALVFKASNSPELENRNMIMVQCYVSKILDMNDSDYIPSVNDSIKLSNLLFNMDISNILNTNLNDFEDASDNNVTVKIDSIYGKTFDKMVKSFRHASVIRHDNWSTIKVSIKSENEDVLENPYFRIIDLNVDFNDVTKYTLKNAMIGSDRDQVIAIDNNGHKLYIAKVYACSLNKIGVKNVLGTFEGMDENEFKNIKITQNNWLIPREYDDVDLPVEVYIDGMIVNPEDGTDNANIIITKQADSDRETAIQINPIK